MRGWTPHPLLSHLLWREADTHDAVHDAVHDALAARFRWMVDEIPRGDAGRAARSHRGADVRELDFLAEALVLGAGEAR
jgi:hypothetical protein